MPYPQREWQNRPYGDPSAPPGAARLNAAFFEELEAWGVSVDTAIEEGTGGNPSPGGDTPSAPSGRIIVPVSSYFEGDPSVISFDGSDSSSGIIVSPLYNDVSISGIVFDGSSDPGRYRISVKSYPDFGVEENWLNTGHLVADRIQGFSASPRRSNQRRLFFSSPVRLFQDSVYGVFIVHLDGDLVISSHRESPPTPHEIMRLGFAVSATRDNGSVFPPSRTNYYPACGIFAERTGTPATDEPPEVADEVYPGSYDQPGKISFSVPYDYDTFYTSDTALPIESSYRTMTEFSYDPSHPQAENRITGIEILNHPSGSNINVEVRRRSFDVNGDVYETVASKQSVAPTASGTDVEVLFDSAIDLEALVTEFGEQVFYFDLRLSFAVETSGVFIPVVSPAVPNREKPYFEADVSYHSSELGGTGDLAQSTFLPSAGVAIRLLHATFVGL